MLNITCASYGEKNVLDIIQKRIKKDKLVLKVSNDIFGDPMPGVLKNLILNVNGEIKVFRENSFVYLPKSLKNKLGIWYSNNNVDNVVYESLQSLVKLKDDADILTCVWRPVKDNPFYQAIAKTQSSNHLNIIIQILQLLYVARNRGDYKYVSFLEHDVLYPEGYFNFPDFETGIMTNMNYKGIYEKGFQKKTVEHEPLHEMTMIFDEAIKHFEKLIKKAIKTQNIFIEPDFNRKQWSCINSAVHVNHGKHYTSHFRIYSKEGELFDPYWGEAKPLIEKLFQ